MFSLQSIAEHFYISPNMSTSFILLQGKRMKHFLRVMSGIKAEILAATDILSFVPQDWNFFRHFLWQWPLLSFTFRCCKIHLVSISYSLLCILSPTWFGLSLLKPELGKPDPGNTNWGRRLSTVKLLIKVACFVNKVKQYIEGASQN
jgi:hypothetical protein